MSQAPTSKANIGPSAAGGGQLAASSVQLTLWRVLFVCSQPFRKLLAVQLFVGRSLYSVFVDFRRSLWAFLGWFSAPPRSLRLRKLSRGYFRVRRWHGIVVTILLAVAANKLKEKIKELTDPSHLRQKQLRKILKNATDFDAWTAAVKELAEIQGKSKKDLTAEWKKQTRLYDKKLLQQRLQHLQAVRASENIQKVIYALRQDLLRNLGNMTNSELHEHFLEVPEPIRQYIEEVKEHLTLLTHYSGKEIQLKEKWEFIKLTRHAFGRTAIVLSGGGALGAFHLGVCKALFQHGLLPRVMAGSSVGSIVAAIVATRDDNMLDELFRHLGEFDLSFFSNSTASQFVRHFVLKGTLQDMEVLQKRLRMLLGDLTFLEAFNLSGRVLNVAVSAADTNEPPRVLNYLTGPNVVLWSAVACSSAFPYLFKPQQLLSKNESGAVVSFTPGGSANDATRRWRDGSLEEDLPMRSLSEMFNVNYFLVSQTNPHIVPALNLKRKFNRKLGNLLEAEWKHRCHQLQQVLPEAVSRWLKVLSQPWEGDVTMVLPSTYSQIKKAITNPTREDLQAACLQGEQSTWAKLSAIRSNCGIEVCLDQCLRELEHQGRLAREEEAEQRKQSGMPRSRVAEAGAAVTGQTEGSRQRRHPSRKYSRAMEHQPSSSAQQQPSTEEPSSTPERQLSSNSREGMTSRRLDRSGSAEGVSNDRLGRSSSALGSGDSSGSGHRPTWQSVPRANSQRVTARIPSWLHLTALGMESVPSEDNLDGLASSGRSAGKDPVLNRQYSSDMMGAPPSGSSGMQLMTKGTSLDTVQESEVAEVAGSETDEEYYAPSLQPAASETLAEFPDWKKDSKDCVDPSANFWDTLAGLRSSAHNHSIGHGLDFIAP